MPTPKTKTPTKKTTETGGTKKSHATPEYGLQAVDELPPEPKRGGGNASRYIKLFAQVAEQPGQMFQIAQFRTRATAKRVVKRVEAGELDVPGDTADWQIIARNLEDGGSALFAQYK